MTQFAVENWENPMKLPAEWILMGGKENSCCSAEWNQWTKAFDCGPVSVCYCCLLCPLIVGSEVLIGNDPFH